MDYLLDVLSQAARVLKPAGHIFVGDLRSLPLLEAYHTSVQLFKTEPATPFEDLRLEGLLLKGLLLEDLRRRVVQSVAQEEELVVDPALFRDLAKHWQRLGRVEIQPKTGAYDNELSRFRYDVVIKAGAKEHIAEPASWLAWVPSGEWREHLQQFLAKQPGSAIGVRGLPDARVVPFVAAAQKIKSGEQGTVEQLTQTSAKSGDEGLKNIDEIVKLAQCLGVGLSWQRWGSDGVYDVILNPQWQRDEVPSHSETRPPSYYRRYANDPSLGGDTAELGKELQEYVRESLPDYMVPSAIVVMASWPLTPSGKIDRRALPAPERRAQASHVPRNKDEQVLRALFAEILSLEENQVGIDENFFALGGHSLMATRLVSKIRASLGIELPLRALFEAPTVEQLALHVAHAQKARPPLVLKPRPERLPLSYAQQRLWFIDQLEGGKSSEYNMPLALRLRGDLDLAALRQTLNTILNRHESLRTRFTEIEGQPVQIIDPFVPVELSVEELSGLSEADQEERVRTAMRRDWEQPFNLSRGPLFYVQLFRVSERDHVLLRNFHHIISDGWSQGIFNREFMVLYEAFQEGRENPLEPLTVQYADYALWQREWLSESVLRGHLEYWKETLAGIPDSLELPKDRPRPPMQSYSADVCVATLPSESVELLKRLGQATQTTLYMSLLAAFAALLQRYSGQEDIVVGSPIANRQDARLEGLIGFFVNSLVLRVRVEAQTAFNELLAQVRSTALGAFQHQDIPFERLVEELSPERSLNKTPIFQVVFALQNASMGAQQLKGIEVEPVGADDLQVRFDIELHVFEHTGHIGFYWHYNRGLFDQWRIEQMAGHYVALIQSAVSAPHTSPGSLNILSSAEQATLLAGFNPSTASFGRANLPALLEEQAAANPAAVAIICGAETLLYQDLNRRANRLAHYLIDLGIGPEQIVGIGLKRSTDMVVALLGVMKAGAAYLPLDLDLPEARLAHILADARPALVLSHQGWRSRLPEAIRVLSLDSEEVVSALSEK